MLWLADGELKKLLVQRICLVQRNLDLTDDISSVLSEVTMTLLTSAY